MATADIAMVDVPVDLIDYVWTEDRPELVSNPIYIHTIDFAGTMVLNSMILKVPVKQQITSHICKILFRETSYFQDKHFSTDIMCNYS